MLGRNLRRRIDHHIPALPTVSETDRQAMFDLRDALPADNDYALQWKRAGQKISLWEGVTLNEEGRVVGIGYDELKYLGNYATKAIAGTMNETATPDEEYGASWSLPESFKQLTALKIFNFDDNPLTEIPRTRLPDHGPDVCGWGNLLIPSLHRG